MVQDKIKIGVGFVTGRKNFKNVVRTYAENWRESGLVSRENISLNLFVAYDLKYQNTTPMDYTRLGDKVYDSVDSIACIGDAEIRQEKNSLISEGILSEKEAELIFGEGYAKKRNVILYFAIKSDIDYLIFMDDDEYPMAVLKIGENLAWTGQKLIATHLQYIKAADITHGYHCGYISPIPSIRFNEDLTEKDFKTFITAISNDIIRWSSIQRKMADGGVTYAEKDLLVSGKARIVEEQNGAKFLSGSNLCINLNSKKFLYPFFNPPGARGEDTFMGTCMQDHTVIKVPCYAFHDGFSAYKHLLNGVLPEHLQPVGAASKKVAERFYRACIGWIRYKPLLVYITRRADYGEIIGRMKNDLKQVLPKFSRYFDKPEFMNVLNELNKYDLHVAEHDSLFRQTIEVWGKITERLYSERRSASAAGRRIPAKAMAVEDAAGA